MADHVYAMAAYDFIQGYLVSGQVYLEGLVLRSRHRQALEEDARINGYWQRKWEHLVEPQVSKKGDHASG